MDHVDAETRVFEPVAAQRGVGGPAALQGGTVIEAQIFLDHSALEVRLCRFKQPAPQVLVHRSEEAKPEQAKDLSSDDPCTRLGSCWAATAMRPAAGPRAACVLVARPLVSRPEGADKELCAAT